MNNKLYILFMILVIIIILILSPKNNVEDFCGFLDFGCYAREAEAALRRAIEWAEKQAIAAFDDVLEDIKKFTKDIEDIPNKAVKKTGDLI